ncbi:TolC family protein [Azonexus hydrophilus]|uniref:TolC family protein n=1 Tax=Azonexus hydrophilus TaxID=418702 RepID=A0ABZ2XDI1_9RHOO|nr:TolC family protein [Azonexus hydrophilus]
MRIFPRFPLWILCSVVLAPPVHAENLARAFADAWARQPAAAAQAEHQQAVAARRAAASAWTPESAAIELGGRSDRFNRDTGAAEVELGLAIPLWLPGERRASQGLAGAEAALLDARLASQQWQLAGSLRTAWWEWQQARESQLLAEGRLAAAERLRDDVGRRVKAGDLARSDLHQAELAVAVAEAELAEASGAQALAAGDLQALTGKAPADVAAAGETPPAETPADDWLDRHPQVRWLQAVAEQARQQQVLARTRNRPPPEITVATRQERDARGAQRDQSWALGVRIPLSAGARHDQAVAEASAGRTEAEIAAQRERERLQQAAALAARQVALAQTRLAAAEKGFRLASENLRLFDKSFRLGETDLPTRLRIEHEAFVAERKLHQARLQLAASLSARRQALGLLPE